MRGNIFQTALRAIVFSSLLALVAVTQAKPLETEVAYAGDMWEGGGDRPSAVMLAAWQEEPTGAVEIAPGVDDGGLPFAPQGAPCGCGGGHPHQDQCCHTCPCECCTPCGACCRGPCWTVRANAVSFWRNDPHSLTFITQPGGADAFNFDQFSFGPELGLDASVILDLGCGRSLEARYLGVWGVQDSLTVGPFPPGAVFFNTTPPTAAFFNGPATFINADYSSELHSGEINGRVRAAQWLTLSAGFRYLNLREEFNGLIHQTNVLGTSVFDIANSQTRNDLYGLQLAADVDFLVDRCGRYRFGGFAKGGGYYAHAEHDLTFVQIDGTAGDLAGGDFTRQGSASDDGVAFVGEAGVQASYQLTRSLAIQVGYQVLWLQGVAMASEQIAASGNIFQPQTNTRIDTHGGVFYHGATAGFELRF